MQYLAERESPIEIVAFSCTEPETNDMDEDNVGHTFPHYYYVRGRTITHLPKGRTLERVVAHPVKKQDIARYVDGSRVLDDPWRPWGTPSWAQY